MFSFVFLLRFFGCVCCSLCLYDLTFLTAMINDIWNKLQCIDSITFCTATEILNLAHSSIWTQNEYHFKSFQRYLFTRNGGISWLNSISFSFHSGSQKKLKQTGKINKAKTKKKSVGDKYTYFQWFFVWCVLVLPHNDNTDWFCLSTCMRVNIISSVAKISWYW